MFKVRRVYDPEGANEGYKVLVDRLWPRGFSKESAVWNEWIKEVAPSNELRKWYNHEPAKWEEFKNRYREELSSRSDELRKLKQLEDKHDTVTLLYSSKERELNNAVALREFLTRKE
jgi:uncharacterized protein YeaO (DUF488 family)